MEENSKKVATNNCFSEREAIRVMKDVIDASHVLRRVSKQTREKYDIKAVRHHIYDDKENCNPVMVVCVEFTMPEEESTQQQAISNRSM